MTGYVRRLGRLKAVAACLAVFAMVAMVLTGPGAAGADTVVQRVNVGGAELFGDPTWAVDTAASPSPLRTGGAEKIATTGATIDTSDPSLPSGTPAALFQSERWDPLGKSNMKWSFPTASGPHRVTLYFAETYAPLGAVGARTFDVKLDGVTVLDKFDVFAEAGAINKGIAKTFTIESDGSVNLEFFHGVQNPIVNGIEVVRVDGAAPEPTLAVSPSQLSFPSTTVSESSSANLTLTNDGVSGSGSLVVNAPSIAGTGASSFAVSSGPTFPLSLAAGQSATIGVSFAPDGAGDVSASLQISHNGMNDTVTVPLSGTGVGPVESGTDLFRINAGGPELAGQPVWSADSTASPSPLRVAGGDNVATTGSPIDMSDPSVPDGTPMSLFQSERWDPAAAPAMAYSFPAALGTYEVTLFFAETYAPVASVGGRVFDVLLEGDVVLANFDVYAAAGAINRGITRSFTVNSDGAIDLQFQHGVQNPIVNGISITALSSAPAPVLDTWPESIAFPATQVGSTSTVSVFLTHSGAASSGPLEISSVEIAGADAAVFGHGFTSPIVLQPGEASAVDVTFSPTSTQPASANLSFVHNGVNSPNVLPLSGATPAASTLQATPPSVTFASTSVGATATESVSLANLGTAGSPNVDITSLQVIGTNSTSFSAAVVGGTPASVAPGASASVDVSFAPQAAGSLAASLLVNHTGLNSPLTVPLSGSAVAPTESAVLYRVNAGGAAVPGDPSWGADTAQAPSVYLGTGGEKVFGNSGTIDLSHPSVPAGTPAALFNSERYDPFKKPQMTWAFPTTPGSYEVRLYFAENWAPNAVPNARLFDVAIEGETVLTDYDIFVASGAANRAVMESFVVESDTTLDISFVNKIENPKISAIEIVELDAGPLAPTLGADTSNVLFPVSPVGETVTMPITLTNGGATEAGPLDVLATTITGPQAAQFSDDFVDGSPVTLAPGASTVLTASLTRTTTGGVSGTLSIEHTGSNSPLTIQLTSNVPTLSASPAEVAFAATVVGNSSVAQVTLTNSGTPGSGSLQVVQSNITGAGAAQFGDSFVDGSSVTLAPGQSTVVDVTFSPAAAAAAAATLTFSHSGNGGTLEVPLSGSGVTAGEPSQINFGKSTVSGLGGGPRPTSLSWGPDGRLYISTLTGQILVATIERNGPNSYSASDVETLQQVRAIPNHNDDGTPNPTLTNRLITGIEVGGTAANPVIYVVSADPRIGSPSTGDIGIDTNSGVLSKLTWNGASWDHLQLVRGLPRSKEAHSVQGLVLDGSTLYMMSGGNTNHGAPSANFQLLPEYALTAAILTVDLAAIGNTTYDLPTLDDEDRPGVNDANDPFGGNDGKNQAILVPGGPVQVWAAGLRNAYDGVMTPTGFYTIDNGGNAGWGGPPVNGGPQGNCTNGVDNTGANLTDSLHRIVGPGYYGGHPNPTRGNKANTFNASNPQSPISTANPAECEWIPNSERGALAFFPTSTNGITQYTTGNFGGAMSGDLLAAGWDNKIYRVELNPSGTQATASALFSNVGAAPLDVIASSSSDPFPGTVITADYGTRFIYIYEPSDYDGAVAPPCTGANSFDLDEDGDGFSNADEILNGTDPCNGADFPPDFDGDFVSDLLDTDDDGDGIPDVDDPFALDPLNGLGTSIPVDLPWNSDTPAAGGILGLGLTGTMVNGSLDYLDAFDPDNMTVIGAAGVVTVDEVPPGDALGSQNGQLYALQLGVDARPSSTGPFEISTHLPSPYANSAPLAGHSFGVQFGRGDQDNYVKVVLAGANGGQVEVVREVNGVPEVLTTLPLPVPGPSSVYLYFSVDPATALVQASMRIGNDGAKVAVGSPFTVPSNWFDQGLAVGIISTSGQAAAPLNASWDFLKILPTNDGPTTPTDPVDPVDPTDGGVWQTLASQPENFESTTMVEAGGQLYVGGGGWQGGGGYHRRYDPGTDQWSTLAPIPSYVDHVQSVAIGGSIYYVGGKLPGYNGDDLDTVYIYDIATNSFSQGAPIPAGRARANAGTAVHNGKIYLAGGFQGGHDGVSSSMFDVYDPVTNSWSVLPSMPRDRDHAFASVVGDKLYMIGGRNSPAGTGAMIAAIDVYDFATSSWSTLSSTLPTLRGGAPTVVVGNEIVVLGGETATEVRSEVEAFNTVTQTWRTLTPMATPRHGFQGASCGGGIYLAGGSTAPLYNPTTLFDVLQLPGFTACGS